MALIVQGLRGVIGGPFDFCVNPGECLAIVGPSGIGKTRLLRMVTELEASTGSVRVGAQRREDLRASQWRRLVMWLPAESGWWEDTVLAHFPVQTRTALPAQFERLGLRPDALQAPVAELSTGERQRIALLRALVLRPAFLLLDEPTSAMDESTTLRVEALLREELSRGLGLVLVSHRAEQVARLATEVLTLTREGLRP